MTNVVRLQAKNGYWRAVEKAIVEKVVQNGGDEEAGHWIANEVRTRFDVVNAAFVPSGQLETLQDEIAAFIAEIMSAVLVRVTALATELYIAKFMD